MEEGRETRIPNPHHIAAESSQNVPKSTVKNQPAAREQDMKEEFHGVTYIFAFPIAPRATKLSLLAFVFSGRVGLGCSPTNPWHLFPKKTSHLPTRIPKRPGKAEICCSETQEICSPKLSMELKAVIMSCSFYVSLMFVAILAPGSLANWDHWWTYSGITGPGYWMLNKDWTLCSMGLAQSPIDVDPRRISFDANLSPMVISKSSGDNFALENTGRVLRIGTVEKKGIKSNISGAALPYSQTSMDLACRVPLLLFSFFVGLCLGDWNDWWTYDGISGHAYWVINKAWFMCNKGRLQSPIDIDLDLLVHDKTMKPLKMDKQLLNGVISNTGQTLRVVRDLNTASSESIVNISQGPLSYRYEFEELFLHFGLDGSRGSEHSIGGRFYAGEIQMFAFNAQLYKNLSEAFGHPGGVVAVSVMIQEDPTGRGINSALKNIAQHAKKVQYKGQTFPISGLVLANLLPSTDHFVTYDGSFTQPGCWEGVTWVVMNKPIYLGSDDFAILRSLQRGDKMSPKAPLAPNVRPAQDINGRSVRTNINFEKTTKTVESNRQRAMECPDLAKNLYFEAALNSAKFL